MAGRLGRKVYRSVRWKRLRLEKLASVNWRCEECGAWCNEVHHRVPIELGGPLFPPLSGLKAVCPPCHFGEHRDLCASIHRKNWRRYNRHRH